MDLLPIEMSEAKSKQFSDELSFLTLPGFAQHHRILLAICFEYSFFLDQEIGNYNMRNGTFSTKHVRQYLLSRSVQSQVFYIWDKPSTVGISCLPNILQK